MLQVAPKPHVTFGVVEFLNTAPMIAGLEFLDDISLVPNVPSLLINCLEQGEVDFALASSIDYQHSLVDLKMLPSGILSSDGSVLTVRVCSKLPIDQVSCVHCDSDSHTSIALMQIVMKEQFDAVPKIISTNIRLLPTDPSTWPDSILMIGDKVVTSNTQHDFPYVLDLGEAWQLQTGLPFVFAAWFGKSDIENEKISRASMLLERQLKCNLQRLEQVVSSFAPQRGWQMEQAYDYLSKNMDYVCTPRHIESLELFFERALALNLISSIKPLELFD